MAKEKAIRVRLMAYDHKILDDSVEKILDVAKKTGAVVKGPIPLPTEKQVYTVLRATFKYKDAHGDSVQVEEEHKKQGEE